MLQERVPRKGIEGAEDCGTFTTKGGRKGHPRKGIRWASGTGQT
jgi:hypothetical protein